MTTSALGCLAVSTSALLLCVTSWLIRLRSTEIFARTFRNRAAYSALVCSTFSSAIYVTFLLSWVYSAHSINGRSQVGLLAFCLGFLTAIYAVVGGLFARGIHRVLVVVSASTVGYLWMLAGAASAAV